MDVVWESLDFNVERENIGVALLSNSSELTCACIYEAMQVNEVCCNTAYIHVWCSM